MPVRLTGRTIIGVRKGRPTPLDSALCLIQPMPWPAPSACSCHGQLGSALTDCEPASDVSAQTCTNGEWIFLRLVSVARRNRPQTISYMDVQSTVPPMGSMVCGNWMRRLTSGCSTPAPTFSPVASYKLRGDKRIDPPPRSQFR